MNQALCYHFFCSHSIFSGSIGGGFFLSMALFPQVCTHCGLLLLHKGLRETYESLLPNVRGEHRCPHPYSCGHSLGAKSRTGHEAAVSSTERSFIEFCA